MALTTHWEWRAFGSVSPRFIQRFDALRSVEIDDTPQRIVDEYLWIPGSQANIKFRSGAGSQDGLKFKRFLGRVGELEQWRESPEEVFLFPLSAKGWKLLVKEVGQNGDHFDAAPSFKRWGVWAFWKKSSAGEILSSLTKIDPRIRTIRVVKARRTRFWGEGNQVKVELARIDSPRNTTSVGLEIWNLGRTISDDRSQQLLRRAIDDLELANESLEVMNYLDFMKCCVD